MKKLIINTIALCAFLATPALAQTPQQGDNTMTDKKVLVAYYSRSGNTKQIAEYIQQATNGDLFEIQTLSPYPEDHQATVDQAKKEIAEGTLPPLKSKVENIQDYDIIFVGSPSWWATIAPPVATFLAEHDLSGKKVVPFVTHGGSGVGNNATDTAKWAKGATVLEGEAFRGSFVGMAQDSVNDWIKKLGI